MAKDYDVGNILINIETKAQSITQTLDNTINKLSSLKKVVNGVSKLNMDNVHKNLDSISKLNFNNITNAFKTLENLDTKSISSFVRQIRNISNINFDKVDFQKMYLQFLAMGEIIQPFIEKIQKAEPALRAFSNAIDLGRVNAQLSVADARIQAINQKAQSRKVIDDIKTQKANYQLEITKKRLDDINKKSDKTKISFDKIFNIGKIYFFVNYFKRFATSLVNVAKSAIDFNETLNKFQVSMGSYYDRSLKFVNSITKAFNLSTESIMNYQSTFKNMLSALGSLDQDVSYELSETLTRMALDYASLFNVSTERAMEQFQAVLSGQIRSIRSVSGYDVSETSIFNIYKELGGTKTMRQLDQVEKRLLRIIAVQQQMEQTSALGDFAKTIDTTANQLKQLGETFKEIGRWLGQLTMVYMQPFVEGLLAGAIALRELLKALNLAKGYVYEDFGEKSIFGEMTESADSANESINALKRNLLGFDKLNILSETTSSETTDYSLLTSKIKEYSRSLDEVTNKANEISKKILEWLGYTYDVNGELEGSGTRLKAILGIVGALITTITTSAIFTKVSALISGITALGAEGGALATVGSKLGVIGAIVTVVVGLFATLYKTNEDFKKSIDEIILRLKENLAPQFESIKQTFATIYESIKPLLDWLWNTALPAIGNILANTIANRIEQIASLFGIVANAIGIVWQLIKALAIDLETIVQGIGAFINAIATGDTSYLDEFIEDTKKRFEELGNQIIVFFQNIGKSIANFFISPLNTAIDLINKLSFDVPDWIPGIGGEHFGFNIPNIPMLANGGVINQPTVAMMGEYAGANSNPEIVTPENLMRQVFVESMLPIAQIIASGNNEVVGAIEDLANRPIEMNGRKLSEAIYSDLEKVSIRKGKTMFATTG